MTAEGNDICLVCGGTSLEPLIFIPGVPMLCNRLCASEAEAANAPRGDIYLIYCLDCGHVANSAFARVNYDGCYENTLTFSPCYRRYAEETARRLICRYGLTGKRIVEIGCGSGDFLRLLSAAASLLKMRAEPTSCAAATCSSICRILLVYFEGFVQACRPEGTRRFSSKSRIP